MQHNPLLVLEMEQQQRLYHLVLHQEPPHNRLPRHKPPHKPLVHQEPPHNLEKKQEARPAMWMEAVGREVWTAGIRDIVPQKNTG